MTGLGLKRLSYNSKFWGNEANYGFKSNNNDDFNYWK